MKRKIELAKAPVRECCSCRFYEDYNGRPFCNMEGVLGIDGTSMEIRSLAWAASCKRYKEVITPEQLADTWNTEVPEPSLLLNMAIFDACFNEARSKITSLLALPMAEQITELLKQNPYVTIDDIDSMLDRELAMTGRDVDEAAKELIKNATSRLITSLREAGVVPNPSSNEAI